MRRIFLLFTALLSSGIGSSEKHTSMTGLPGSWSTSCASGSTLKSISMEENFLEINKNQIYIKTKAKTNKDTIDLILIDPEDLGPGGMRINWDSFSREKPIAEIKNLSAKTLQLKWLGFYDKNSKSRVWLNEPDFMQLGDDTFHRCSDN